MASLWFWPICDRILLRIQEWHRVYQQGEVHSTREWVNNFGQVEDLPTKYIHKIPWQKAELEHLIRMLQEAAPKSAITRDFEKILTLWPHGQMMAGGHRVLSLAFYKQDLEDLIKILEGIKRGSAAIAPAPDGKELFQL